MNIPLTPESRPGKSRVTLRASSRGDAVTETLWEAVGGEATFALIAREFYARVKEDELLAPMYPQDDWDGAETRLRMFLEQYWGGPPRYSETRGHPRLRMRHQPFRVTPEARDRWLKHMNAALDAAQLAPAYDAAFRDYVERAAHALVNTFE